MKKQLVIALDVDSKIDYSNAALEEWLRWHFNLSEISASEIEVDLSAIDVKGVRLNPNEVVVNWTEEETMQAELVQEGHFKELKCPACGHVGSMGRESIESSYDKVWPDSFGYLDAKSVDVYSYAERFECIECNQALTLPELP